jgi:hypothetical protein
VGSFLPNGVYVPDIGEPSGWGDEMNANLGLLDTAVGDIASSLDSTVGPGSTTRAAVTLANCDSKTADGPLSPAAVWYAVGTYTSFVTSAGDVPTGFGGSSIAVLNWNLNAGDVYSTSSSMRLACSLGADYVLLPGQGVLTFAIKGVAKRNHFEVVVSDQPWNPTGGDFGLGDFATAGVLQAYPLAYERASLGNGWARVYVPLTGLTSLRSFGLWNRGWSSGDTEKVDMRIDRVQIKEASELEYALAASDSGVIVPKNYVSSITPSNYIYKSAPGANTVIDLRTDRRVVYGGGGKRHIREAFSGSEDGSVDAGIALTEAVSALRKHSLIEFPAEAVYSTNNPLDLQGVRDIIIDGQGCTLQKSIDGTGVPNVRLIDCYNVELRNFRIIGYDEKTILGNEMNVIAGTCPTVGTAKTLSTQLDEVSSGKSFFGRLADGGIRSRIRLSDTAQVPQDVRVDLVRDWDGMVLGSRVLTLTNTPTDYTVDAPNVAILHEMLSWRIRKLTATVNTITVDRAIVVNQWASPGGGGTDENEIGVLFTDDTDECRLKNITFEGIPTYAWNVRCAEGFGSDIYIEDTVARVLAVQGVAVSQGQGPVYYDRFHLSEVHGNGIDIEPNVPSRQCNNVRITNGTVENVSQAAFVSTGWSNITNTVVDNVDVVDCGSLAAYGWGSIGGRFANVRARKLGNGGDDTMLITGNNMLISNVVSEGGFKFSKEVLGPKDYSDQEGGSKYFYAENTGNVVDGWQITKPQMTSQVLPADNQGNTIRNVSTRGTNSGLVATDGVPGITNPAWMELSGLSVPDYRGFAPFTIRGGDIHTRPVVPGGFDNVGQPLYGALSLNGDPGTPVTYHDASAGTNVAGNSTSVDVGIEGVADLTFNIISGPYDGDTAMPIPNATTAEVPSFYASKNANGSGVINGARAWNISYLTANGTSLAKFGEQGAGNPDEHNMVNCSVNIGLPIGPAGVTGRVVYRTAINANVGTYKYVTTIPNNTDTLYVDNNLDAALGAAYADPLLRFYIEGSTDNSNWYILRRGSGMKAQTLSTRIFMGSFRYLRIRWTIGGVPTPVTYKFTIRGNYSGPRGSNLGGNVALTNGASTRTITFPTKSIQASFDWDPVKDAGDVRQTLTGTAYYRVALRPAHGGPGVARGPDTVSAIDGKGVVIRPGSAASFYGDGWLTHGITVYRSTDGTNYTKRCDITPVSPDQLSGHRAGPSIGGWSDLGTFVENQALGWGFAEAYPWTDCSITATALDTRNETGYEPDANYKVTLGMNAPIPLAVSVTAKRVDGFDVKLSGNAVTGDTLDWHIERTR